MGMEWCSAIKNVGTTVCYKQTKNILKKGAINAAADSQIEGSKGR
jgi:hypothetical protein